MTVRPALSVRAGSTFTFDVAVVGSGAAGISVALRAASRGLSVAVMEAGGTSRNPLIEADYEGEVLQPADHRLGSLTSSRLRFLGGSTNHWAGWSRPLLPEVFSERPWVSATAWPLSFGELDPHYAWANEVLELGRYEFSAGLVGEELGHTSPVSADGVLTAPLWRFSPPTRFASRFRPELEGDGISVFLHAPLVEARIRAGRVQELVFGRDASDGGQLAGEFSVRAEQFVFAMGGVETVRHLLALAQQQPGLRLDESGWLGRGWMEHPHLAIASLRELEVGPDLSLHTDRLLDGSAPVKAGIGLSHTVAEEFGLAAFSVTVERRDERVPTSQVGKGVATLAESIGYCREERLLFARTEQRPHRDNRVVLSGSVDRFGMRRPRLIWRLQEADVRDLRIGSRLLAERLGASGIGMVRDLDAPTSEYPVFGGNHHMGGARMHESKDHGIVDPFGRVHALPNLVLATSAVFPTSCFSNPTMTIVALSSRFVDAMGQ